MSKDIQRMCKWDKKKLKKDTGQFSNMVKDPEFACKKCIRVAHSKKNLCDPVKLP